MSFELKGGDEMKNNNNMLTTIVVAVIVALITSAVTVALMNRDNVGLAPTTTKTIIAPVRANSCDADGVCEVYSINSASGITVGSQITTDTSINAANLVLASRAQLVNLGQPLNDQENQPPYEMTFYYTQNNQATVEDVMSVFLDGVGTQDPQPRVNFDATVQFSQFTGSGNDYACLTAEGILYRSETTCN
mgnify:CR=1 FL=1